MSRKNIETVTIPVKGAGTSLLAAMDLMDEVTRARFEQHLKGGTSAEYLAGWLKRFGQPVSATTIRTYRRAVGV